jgi:hypothetical protein
VLSRYDFGLTARSRTALQHAVNGAYFAADHDLQILRGRGDLPGTLYVFGDPIVLLRANRPQAVPILGWGPEFLDAKAWQQLYADLRSTLPTHIVLNRDMAPTVQSRCPAIIRLLEDQYSTALVGSSGTWYVRRDLSSTAPQEHRLGL